MAVDVDGVLQDVESGGLGENVEWREQHGAVVLLLFQRFPARQDPPGLLDLVIAPLEPVAAEQIEQHEGVAGAHRIDRERAALEILIGFHVGRDREAQQAVVAAHECEQVGRRRDRHLTLQNFVKLFTDPDFLDPLWTTAIIATTSATFCCIVAAPMGWLVSRTDGNFAASSPSPAGRS